MRKEEKTMLRAFGIVCFFVFLCLFTYHLWDLNTSQNSYQQSYATKYFWRHNLFLRQENHHSYYILIGALFLIKISQESLPDKYEVFKCKEAKIFLLLCCDSGSQIYLGYKHHKTTYGNAHLVPFSPCFQTSTILIKCKGQIDLTGESFLKTCWLESSIH